MFNSQSLIQEFIKTVKSSKEKLKIGVIGDIIIDEYFEIEVNRISPEFPIQVLHSSNNEPTATLPGGAANVAMQLSKLPVDCTLFGVADNDAAQKISKKGFNLVTQDCGIATPRKRRFYNSGIPLTRWDVENITHLNKDKWMQAREHLVEKLEKFCYQQPDIIIMSDYAKGLFYGDFAQTIIEMCLDYDIPTLVDPKKEPLEQWNKCTIFKPNHSEATKFANNHNIYLENIKNQLECEAVVITDGENGVHIYEQSKPKFHHKLEEKVKQKSVVGAGDCFSSFYAVAYAFGFNFRESSIIAHHAGSIYIGNQPNRPITIFDIRRNVNKIESKIQQSAGELSQILKEMNGRKVFTNGCFDLLHCGHLESLKFAKSQGDILIVAVDSDANCRELKGESRPIHKLEDRMKMLASLEYVDFVIPFSGSPYETIKKLTPIECLVKGGSYSADEIIGTELVERVAICPLLDDISTTKIINRINSNE